MASSITGIVLLPKEPHEIETDADTSVFLALWVLFRDPDNNYSTKKALLYQHQFELHTALGNNVAKLSYFVALGSTKINIKKNDRKVKESCLYQFPLVHLNACDLFLVSFPSSCW